LGPEIGLGLKIRLLVETVSQALASTQLGASPAVYRSSDPDFRQARHRPENRLAQCEISGRSDERVKTFFSPVYAFEAGTQPMIVKQSRQFMQHVGRIQAS
jgi:hypothetical protein